MSTETFPFTYLIGWSFLNKWYYGVRHAKNCHPNDMFTIYFTSSKIVNEYVKIYGQPDIIQIRKKFKTKQDALEWEYKVLKRMKILSNDKFLNQSIPGKFPSGRRKGTPASNKGVPMSEEQKTKISQTRKRLGLGKKATKNLPIMIGDKNPMKKPEIAKKLSNLVTGRKRKYRPDGSWFWFYPSKEAGPLDDKVEPIPLS